MQTILSPPDTLTPLEESELVWITMLGVWDLTESERYNYAAGMGIERPESAQGVMYIESYSELLPLERSFNIYFVDPFDITRRSVSKAEFEVFPYANMVHAVLNPSGTMEYNGQETDERMLFSYGGRQGFVSHSVNKARLHDHINDLSTSYGEQRFQDFYNGVLVLQQMLRMPRSQDFQYIDRSELLPPVNRNLKRIEPLRTSHD